VKPCMVGTNPVRPPTAPLPASPSFDPSFRSTGWRTTAAGLLTLAEAHVAPTFQTDLSPRDNSVYQHAVLHVLSPADELRWVLMLRFIEGAPEFRIPVQRGLSRAASPWD
jgi:hypothetical protein